VLHASGIDSPFLEVHLRAHVEGHRHLLSHEALRAQLARQLPRETAPEDRIQEVIYKAVEERIKPSYSMIPAEYLQQLTTAAVARDRARVRRYFRLVTRFLHPAECEGLNCRVPNPFDPWYAWRVGRTVCGSGPADRAETGAGAAITWPRSLTCEFDRLPAGVVDSLINLMALWDGDVWDGSERVEAHRHRIWQRPSYRDPGTLFRSELFRPTLVQARASRHAFLKLFTLSTTYSDHTLLPALGFIIPAFRSVDIPVRVPGYLEVQGGPYIPLRGEETKVRASVSVMYDRQFSYFWGWFVRAQYVFGRKQAQDPAAGSDFTISAGPSFWAPSLFGVRFVRWLHLRPGLRVDTDAFRPDFGRVGWELQLEYRR
jgi:hypothetical protein